MSISNADHLSPDVVIIDYGMGNLRSVQKKFDRLHTVAHISSDPDIIARARKLVLPGVGHFANGVRNLKQSGIWEVLNHSVLTNHTPILGICLGMQLMTQSSEEGDEEGLGWFDARVERFRVSNRLTYKVPHMGWNTAEQAKGSALFATIPESALFYFVHAYHVHCHTPEDVLATTTYDYPFVSAISKGNIFGTQFHPEKSHAVGEQLLANFIGLAPNTSDAFSRTQATSANE